MKNRNQAFVIVIGIVLVIMGILTSTFLLLFIGVIVIAVGSKIKGRNNGNYNRYGQIRSGSTQNMTQYNKPTDYVRSTSNYAKNTVHSLSAPSVKNNNVNYDECNIDGCNPNECPICKSFSMNGYCNNCGYKFRH